MTVRILLISLLIGCSTALAQGPFYKYVRDFLTYCHIYDKQVTVNNLTIGFGETKWLGEDTIGICETGWFTDPKITILHSYWDEASDIGRMLLMYHELGHCLLDRDHNYSLYLNHDPVSIMFPYILSDVIYKRHTNEYIKELFNEKTRFIDGFFRVCRKGTN